MTDVRFDLEPHQWPPGARGERAGFADAVFTVGWNGAQVEAAARWIKVCSHHALLYFRRVGEDALHVVAFKHGERVGLYFLPDISRKQRVNFIEKTVRNALAGWGLIYGYAVRVPLPELKLAVPQWLFLLHDASQGAWQGELPGYATPFSIENRSEISLAAMRDPESSLGFALQWSQLSRDDLTRRAVRFTNGTFRELEALVTSVAILDAALKEGYCQTTYYVNGSLIQEQRSFTGFECAPPDARRRRWAFHLNHYFSPRLDPDLTARHPCVAQSCIHVLVSLSSLQPTQHERLEAALLLREWAKGKIPPSEARLLLPKL